MNTISLDAYEHAERQLARDDARVGLTVHSIVTAVVWGGVVLVNVLVGGFPWSIFVVAGTGMGLGFHWWGSRRADLDIERHQRHVESMAARR